MHWDAANRRAARENGLVITRELRYRFESFGRRRSDSKPGDFMYEPEMVNEMEFEAAALSIYGRYTM